MSPIGGVRNIILRVREDFLEKVTSEQKPEGQAELSRVWETETEENFS